MASGSKRRRLLSDSERSAIYGSHEIDLHDCRLSESDVDALLEVRDLSLKMVQLPSGALGKLRHLARLELSNLDWVDLAELRPLATTVKALRIARMKTLSDYAGLSELQALELLDLDGLKVGGAEFPSLGKNTLLRRVDLRDVTGKRLLPEILEAPNLRALMLLNFVDADSVSDVARVMNHPTLEMFTWYPPEKKMEIGAAFDVVGLPMVRPIGFGPWLEKYPIY